MTELVTGLDLVHEQLWLASGAPLSERARTAARQAAQPGSHAIEVRISLEDPSRSFLPLSGRLGRFTLAAGPGIRVDTALGAGEWVPPDYDPLAAKLLVHAADRPAAIDRLARALDETEIDGVQTTLPFHRFVARDPGFRAGRLSTDFVDRSWDGPATRASAARRALLAAGLAGIPAAGPPAAATPEAGPAGASTGRRPAPTGWHDAARSEAVDRWPR